MAIKVSEGPILATRFGITGDGSDETSKVQQWLDEAGPGEAFLNIQGTVVANGVQIRDGQQVCGLWILRSLLLSTTSGLALISCGHHKITDLSLISKGLGHVIEQSGLIDQGTFENVWFQQYGGDFSIWENSGNQMIGMRFGKFYSHHTQSATVPS